MATMQQVLSQAQVAQINASASKVANAPSITGVVALIALVAMGQFGTYGGVIVFIVGLIGTIPVRSGDRARRTTSLYYTVTDERFASIQRACENLADAQRVWYVEAEQQNWDWKRQAGAQSLVSRKQGRVGVINPPFISTNVDVCSNKTVAHRRVVITSRYADGPDVRTKVATPMAPIAVVTPTTPAATSIAANKDIEICLP
jgi:hypothetical protein